MSPEYEAALKAIKNKDISEIKKTLAAVPDLNETSSEEASSEHGENLTATLIRRLPDNEDLIDTVKILLTKGLKLDTSIDNFGNTPLLCSLANGKPGLAKFLIEQDKDKVSLNKKDSYRDALNTPLLLAIKEGFEEVACLLLKKGADPNIPTKAGITPLGLAAAVRQDSVIEALLKAGAENTPDKFGMSPYEYYSWEFTGDEKSYIRFPAKLKNDRFLVCSQGYYNNRMFAKKDSNPKPLSFVDLLRKIDSEFHDHGAPFSEGGDRKDKNETLAKKLLLENHKNTLQEQFNTFVKNQDKAHGLALKGQAYFYTKDSDDLMTLIGEKTEGDYIEADFEQFTFPYSDPERTNLAPALIKAVKDKICTIEEIEKCLTDPINKLQFMIAKLEYEMETCSQIEKPLKEEKIKALKKLEPLLLAEPPKVEKFLFVANIGGGSLRDEPEKEDNQKKEEKTIQIQNK